MEKLTAEMFLKDVAEHQMKILIDTGTYRHILFNSPKWNLWFELVTWPNALTIRGDMGTWTFSRVEDMFTFFRDKDLRINPSYWAEKLCGGQHGGSEMAMVWDDDTFKEQILSLVHEERPEVIDAIKEDLFREEGQYDLDLAARNFTRRLSDGDTFSLDPCDIPSGTDYSYRFLWCLYAIVWGIRRWDETRNGQDART
jgi:hypothetical protein